MSNIQIHGVHLIFCEKYLGYVGRIHVSCLKDNHNGSKSYVIIEPLKVKLMEIAPN